MVDEPHQTDPAIVQSRPMRRLWLILAGIMAAVVAGGLLAMLWIVGTWMSEIAPIPQEAALWQMRRTPGIRFLDHKGVVIAARGAKYGASVTLSSLPNYVPKAFLAAEDRRFYSHGAIDPQGILRAARRDLFLGRAAEGGSTISQQLARTLFLTSEHSLKRKVQEAVLAGRLEKLLGKDAVLDLYLNRIYFGAGAYGLDSAAHTYFGKGATELTLSEAVVLASLPNAPSRLAPTVNMAGAWARGQRILQTMRRERWVDPLVASDIVPPALVTASRGEGDWGYVLDQAAVQAATLAGAGALDLIVRLTVDAKLQSQGLASVREGVLVSGRNRNVSQGALVVLAPDGAIRVMVAGLDHRASVFNRVTQAKRQPGSAFKAFVFAAALEAGDRPEDTRIDAPITDGGWAPENYARHFLGAVSLSKALALSINSVAVRLTLEVGPAQVAAFARRCGLVDIPANPGASIALGAYEVTPLALASAYQVFQNGGGVTTPYLIEAISDTRGRSLYAHTVNPTTSVLDPLYASRMVRMLEGVITNGTGVKAEIGRPAAGKTGTSQRWRDAWFVGFTPDLLAAVWVGNDNGASMDRVTGGDIPAAIWRRFMSSAEANRPTLDFTWLQPEPAAPPSSGDYESAVGPALIDEPSPDRRDDASPFARGSDENPPLPPIGPREDVQERGLDREHRSSESPMSQKEEGGPLPTPPSPF